MNELDLIQDEEQSLLAAMKAVRIKRESALAAIAEEEAFEAELRREELAKKVAELKPVLVFGVSYQGLRKRLLSSSVRFVRVHPDVRSLLVAALPSENEERFCELCTTLVTQLLQHSNIYHQLREHVEVLRSASDTRRYFEPEHQDTVVVIAGDRKMQMTKHEVLADTLAVWALEWGKLSNYEEQE